MGKYIVCRCEHALFSPEFVQAEAAKGFKLAVVNIKLLGKVALTTLPYFDHFAKTSQRPFFIEVTSLLVWNFDEAKADRSLASQFIGCDQLICNCLLWSILTCGQWKKKKLPSLKMKRLECLFSVRHLNLWTMEEETAITEDEKTGVITVCLEQQWMLYVGLIWSHVPE